MGGDLSFPDGAWPPRWAHEFADNPHVLADVQRALDASFEGTDYPRSDPRHVVASVLAETARELRGWADEQETCNKVDECHAEVAVQRQLAAWLSSVVLSVEDPTAADRAWLNGLSDGR